MKGYSLTVPISEAHQAPRIGGVDEDKLIAFSRLGDRLRLAATAEFVGYDPGHRPNDFRALLATAKELFPNGGDYESAEPWAGLRPMTPSSVPILGRAIQRNLYLNVGHGHVGWTMCCGSGKFLADLVAGRKPEIDPEGLLLRRVRTAPSMSGPKITIDLERIERNARAVVSACAKAGIEVFGVTKGTCGMPQVARAMLRGGVIGIGKSRFENIRRLRASGIDCLILLLRGPPLSRVEEVVASVDISLNSELAIIEELSRVAGRMSKIHDIILMVDLGDLREGIWPDELVPTVEKVLELPHVRIAGARHQPDLLRRHPADRGEYGRAAGACPQARAAVRAASSGYVSGGNSSSLPLVLAGKMPPASTICASARRSCRAGAIRSSTSHGRSWIATPSG